MTILANTAGQPLDQHLALTGLLARKIIYDLCGDQNEFREAWGAAAFVAGLFHDIGKTDPNFQRFIVTKGCTSSGRDSEDGVHIQETRATKGFTFNEYPRHNEVSWYLMANHLDGTWPQRASVKLNSELLKSAKYAVYWHHAKPLRESDEKFKDADSISSSLGWIEEHYQEIESVLRSAFELAGESVASGSILAERNCINEAYPAFKGSYESVASNTLKVAIDREARHSLIRSALVTADRFVSKLTPAQLAEHLELYRLEGALTFDTREELTSQQVQGTAETCSQIMSMVDRFEVKNPGDLRNAVQSQAASDLLKNSFSILQGPAGCGKTKIMLQYIAQGNSDTQCFIFAPRTAIAEGLYQELVAEYGVTHSVEVISSSSKMRTSQGVETPVSPGSEFTSDIVLATFDQLCSVALSHSRVDVLTRVLCSTVIVDEFHELFDVSGVILLFLELMKLRMTASTQRTLLVSATPLNFLVAKLNELNTRMNAPPLLPVVVDSFNLKPFQLAEANYAMDEGQLHPFEELGTPGNIYIANTATRAQSSAVAALMRKEKVLCCHSKFTPRHKKEVLLEVMKKFGKNSGAHEVALYAGPIVQASLNITTRHLHTEATHAENFLQRLGRTNRFGSFEEAFVTVYRKTGQGTKHGVDTREAARLHQKNRTIAWAEYMLENGLFRMRCTIAEMYGHYQRFHQEARTQTAYEDDFELILGDCAKTFRLKAFDPVQLPPSVAGKAGKLSAKSLRGGGSCYILPVEMVYEGGGRLSSSRWLWGEASFPEDVLTDEMSSWTRVDEADTGSMLSYLRSTTPGNLKYIANLPPAVRKLAKRKSLKFYQVLMLARSQSTPVVVSFPGEQSLGKVEREYLTLDSVRIGLVKSERIKPFLKKT